MPDTENPILIREPEVLRRTALSRTRLFELVRDQRFPAPIKLAGANVNAWSSTEVGGWIVQQLSGRN